tara:strand:- start:630 stop:812 length:183 start_codon:yes stop_codon:yes gene_type:complete
MVMMISTRVAKATVLVTAAETATVRIFVHLKGSACVNENRFLEKERVHATTCFKNILQPA